LNSPDDSSLDHFEQCSSYASFCSAQSHISHIGDLIWDLSN